MFKITKEEFEKLTAKFGSPYVTICSKRKKNGGKTYWCAENDEYHYFIDKLRENKMT